MKGIISVTQVSIQCHNCSNSYVDAHLTQKNAIRDARKDGWSIGKNVVCPECLAEGKRVKADCERICLAHSRIREDLK